MWLMLATRRYPRRRVQPDVRLPNAPANLPTHGKSVAGIATDLIPMPDWPEGHRIGAIAEQRHEVVSVPDDLQLALLAPAPAGEHGTAPECRLVEM